MPITLLKKEEKIIVYSSDGLILQHYLKNGRECSVLLHAFSKSLPHIMLQYQCVIDAGKYCLLYSQVDEHVKKSILIYMKSNSGKSPQTFFYYTRDV